MPVFSPTLWHIVWVTPVIYLLTRATQDMLRVTIAWQTADYLLDPNRDELESFRMWMRLGQHEAAGERLIDLATQRANSASDEGVWNGSAMVSNESANVTAIANA